MGTIAEPPSSGVIAVPFVFWAEQEGCGLVWADGRETDWGAGGWGAGNSDQSSEPQGLSSLPFTHGEFLLLQLPNCARQVSPAQACFSC